MEAKRAKLEPVKRKMEIGWVKPIGCEPVEVVAGNEVEDEFHNIVRYATILSLTAGEVKAGLKIGDEITIQANALIHSSVNLTYSK